MVMEFYEKGYFMDDEFGDVLFFRWGNIEVFYYYIEKIVYRKDFGDKLVEGSYCFVEMYGYLEFLMSVKKFEFFVYDLCGVEGYGFGYVINNCGGCYIKNYMISFEIFGYLYKMDLYDISDEKVKMFIFF